MEEHFINGLRGRIKQVNPKKEPLTKEKLKTFKGFENLNDDEIQEILFSIQSLSNILYEHLSMKTGDDICNESEIKNAA